MISNQNQKFQVNTPTLDQEDDIDLIAIIKTLWISRKTLLICLLSGLFIGLLVAFLSPKEYTVSTVMVPQNTGGSKSQLSSLASLAGIDLGNSQSSELSPILYPQIVNSIPYKLELMNIPLHFSKVDKPISMYEYYLLFYKPSIFDYIKKYTIGLPSVIMKNIAKKPKVIQLSNDSDAMKLISISRIQYLAKRFLDEAVTLEVDRKEGYLTLIVTLSEPLAAAELAQSAQELLQRDITQFKIEKAQADLDFILSRYNVAKAEAEQYQYSVATQTDRFKNLTSNVPQISSSRSQTKFNIANSVYMDLAKQLEQAKIQVKRDTPVFTIIEPVTIPTKESYPNPPMILFVFFALGGVVGISIIFGKQVLQKIKQRVNAEN